jgi:very-short-patch-repair endonuclease
VIVLAGLPAPELQAWVQGADGRPYRADFFWRKQRVIGEADGLVKYATIDDVRAEKRREDALRQAGYALVRWTSQELRRTPDRVMARLRHALHP